MEEVTVEDAVVQDGVVEDTELDADRNMGPIQKDYPRVSRNMIVSGLVPEVLEVGCEREAVALGWSSGKYVPAK